MSLLYEYYGGSEMDVELSEVPRSELEQADGKPRSYRARLFTEKPNRRGDVVVVSGMDTDTYMRNPVVMLQHGREYGMPIGRATGVKRGATYVDAFFEFDQSDEVAKRVEQKMNDGFMKTFSIGFNVQDAERVSEDDDSWFGPMRYTKTQLLEFSVVSIPIDVTAMRKQALEGVAAQAESDEQPEPLTLADVFGDVAEIMRS